MNRNTDKNNPHRYDDMLDLPHHQSSTRPHMSMANRAAQFSPFAALTGFDDKVMETARLTDEKIELSDTEKERLDKKLRFLSNHLDEHPTVSVTYFVPDAKKAGGAYTTNTGIVKRIDTVEQKIIFYAENMISDGWSVSIDTIVEIE
ncbi:MAG: hypothetical protein Q4C91_17590 [Eubacteriales bacterium]|nr:hypothetical protein [Eubacteriales bacterium]